MVQEIHLERAVRDTVTDDDRNVIAAADVVHDSQQKQSHPLGNVSAALAVWRAGIELATVFAKPRPFVEFFREFAPLLCLVVNLGKQPEILLAQEIILMHIANEVRRRGLDDCVLRLACPQKGGIPDGCPRRSVRSRFQIGSYAAQWGLFVRNHDELDLGRLSERQRNEVFAAFGPDKDMQLYDRGIRRRFAPMMGGNEDRIRMAYSLTFSLPGTPVLRYGDEIGMGDDLSLPERQCARTPMQ